MTNTSSDAERDTIARDEVARLNQQELIRLMSAHSLFIPARDFPNWRPTKTTTGDILGIASELTVIATNGVLGYFLTATGEVFIGHTQKFNAKVQTLSWDMSGITGTSGGAATNKPRKKVKSKRQQLLESL